MLRWLFVLLASLAGLFFSLRITLNDNALDLLPGAAVRGDIEKLGKMGLVDRLVVTLTIKDGSGLSAEEGRLRIKTSVTRLGEELERNDQFSSVLYHLEQGVQGALMEYLDKSLPFLLDKTDYSRLESRISRDSIDRELRKVFTLLNSPAGIGLKKRILLDPLSISLLGLEKLKFLRLESSMILDDGYFMSSNGRSSMLIAESRRSLTDSKEAKKIAGDLKTAFERTLDEAVEARVIGTLPHTLANAETIGRDLRTLLPAATILLIVLLGATLRNVRAVAVFGVPLLAALPAVAIISLLYGQVSGIALGFGIVLLGIGVDFSVHLYLILVRKSGTLQERFRVVRKPIFYATLTTSAVFIILHFSSVASHRQMATLALAGILLSVAFSWILIPTIVPKISTNGLSAPSGPEKLHAATVGNKAGVITMGVWGCVLLLGVMTWPRLQYNGDLRVLDVPDEKVIEDEKFFSKTWGEKGEQIFILIEGGLENVLENNSKIYRYLVDNDVGQFRTIAPLLPGNESQGNNLVRWREFWQENRNQFEESFVESAGNLGFNKDAFKPFFDRLDRPLSLPAAKDIIGGPLNSFFSSMLKRQYESSEEGKVQKEHYFAMTTVAADKDKISELMDNLRLVPGATIIANSKWRTDVERLLRLDVLFLSSIAGIVIVLLVVLQFRNVWATVGVLAPVLSALSAMSIFCWVTDGQLNMMHLIMGIMVIGLSVDYGIFTVCSRLSSSSGKTGSTTARAVSICAASSLVGFGVLVFAQHPALHALGVTVMVGIGVAWPTALYVSPLFLTIRRG